MQGATETEDKASLALSELWALLCRPEIKDSLRKHVAHYPDRIIPLTDQLFDLVKEVEAGLELMPYYRRWANAVLEIAEGKTTGELSETTQRSLIEDGAPMHLQAVERLAERWHAAELELQSLRSLAQAGADFVIEIERHEGLRESITGAIDQRAGLGAQCFTKWQDLRAHAAAHKLAHSKEPIK